MTAPGTLYDYKGDDAGYLVTSVAAQAGTVYDAYSFYFRNKDGSVKSRIWWGQQNIFDSRKPDFNDTAESGVVDIRKLPPGNYEIYNFDVFYNGGYVQSNFRPEQDFSIPFVIQPAQTTSIGEYRAVGLRGRNIFGLPLRAGAYFLVSDKSQRDIPMAKVKNAAIGEVHIEVVDPSSVGNPLIRATDP